MSDNKIVVFTVAGNNYATGISTVKEIVPMQRISTVPMAPTGVEGVTSLRGVVLPVVSLSTLLGLGPNSLGNTQRIMVVETEDRQLGCVVDSVTEVLTVDSEDIKPLPTGIEGNYLQGVIDTDDGLVVLMDLKGLVSL